MSEIIPKFTTLLAVPDKFILILKETIYQEITRHKQLLTLADMDDVPQVDKVLSDIAYGYDMLILQAILQELDNPNQRVEMAFYKLCQTADKSESTLLPIDRPTPQGEMIELVFGAKDWEQARQIANRYLGFE